MSRSFTAEVSPFADIAPNDWYCEAVSRAKVEGILEGYPDGSFKPEGLVTYAEFLRMAVKDAPSTTTGHWAAGYYSEGVNRSLFTEYEIRMGSLDQPIPRKYMALVFDGLLRKNDAVPIATFSDIDSRSAFEYYIAKSAAAGLLIGYPDGTFRPEGFLTRAEAATAFVRLSDIFAAYDGEEVVPVESVGEEEVKISDIADPFCLEYLNSILQTVSFSGSNGLYEYSFAAPYVPDEYKNFLDLSFFSFAGKQILFESNYSSRNREAHTVEKVMKNLHSLSQIGFVHFEFAITQICNMNWLCYTLRLEDDGSVSLRIEYKDNNSGKIYTEYSTIALNHLFTWE